MKDNTIEVQNNHFSSILLKYIPDIVHFQVHTGTYLIFISQYVKQNLTCLANFGEFNFFSLQKLSAAEIDRLQA